MTQNGTKKGIYPGWFIVVTSMFLMAILFASAINLPGVFTIFVTEELGITRTAFTTHMTICTLTSMVAALFVGKLLQKHNIKLMMTAAAVVSFLGFLGYSFAGHVWHFYIISAVLGFCLMFLTSVPISILINNWFGKKLKGKAMGIAMTGSGIGAMILNPVLTYINSTYSWRLSYRLIALLTLVVIIPLILTTVSKSPQDRGLARLGDEEGAPEASGIVTGMTAAQALRSKLFWTIFLTFFLFAMTTTVFNVNALPYMTDMGIDAVKAGTFMSISSFGVIVGKLLLGTACDKWGAKKGATGAISCLVIGLMLFIFTSRLFGLAPAATFLFGVGNALATVTMPLIIADLFGNRDFGALVGYSNMASSLGASVGPLFGALIFDASGSYVFAWGSDIVLMLAMLATLYIAYKMVAGAYVKIKQAPA